MDDRREWQRLRAAVLAGLSGVLTAAGHSAGGAGLPDFGSLALMVPLLAGTFTVMAGRCRGIAGTVAVLGAGQLALHHVMELLHPAHHPAPDPAAAGWRMLAMHAGATLVIAVVLRYADRAVAGLAAALGRVVRRRLVQPPADRPLPVRPVPDLSVSARLGRTLAAAQLRRGPPVGC